MRAQLFIFRRSLICLAWAACAACASAPPPSQGRIDTAFRAIQRGEAQLEAAAREVDRVAASVADDAGACVERCAPLGDAIGAAREGAGAVCDAAATIEGDSDARVRCERARAGSAGIEQRARELKQRCGCGEGGAS